MMGKRWREAQGALCPVQLQGWVTLGSLSTHAAFLRLQKQLERRCLLLERASETPINRGDPGRGEGTASHQLHTAQAEQSG